MKCGSYGAGACTVAGAGAGAGASAIVNASASTSASASASAASCAGKFASLDAGALYKCTCYLEENACHNSFLRRETGQQD